MKTIKIIIAALIVSGILALGYFVGAWAAILVTAFLGFWIIFSEFYNQIF